MVSSTDFDSKWNGLVITCPNEKYSSAITTEICSREKNGLLPTNLTTICIHDPKEGFGSGGATINAILSMTEYLSAQKGFTGRSFPYGTCGKGFVNLPLKRINEENSVLLSNFDVLFNILTKQLGSDSPPGVWVCSTDMILQIPQEYVTDWSHYDEDTAYCFGVKSDIEYATKHGVFKLDSDKSKEDLRRNDIFEPDVVTGVVFFPTKVAEKVLNLHVHSPIDSSTYLGLDSGCDPVQISLFFDILLAMASDVDKENYIRRCKNSPQFQSNINKEKGNLVIGKNCVIIGVDYFQDDLMEIPDNSFVMGMYIDLPMMEAKKIHLCLPCTSVANTKVLFDRVGNAHGDTKNNGHNTGFKYLNRQSSELDTKSKEWLNLLSQKLFPVAHTDKHLSLHNIVSVLLHENCTEDEQKTWSESWNLSFFEITDRANVLEEFEYRSSLFNAICCRKVKQILLQNTRTSLQPLLSSLVCGKAHIAALQSIDEVINECQDLCVVIRAFYSIADILEFMAGKQCGLRSGPACNKEWREAFTMLDNGNIKDGAQKLVSIRKSWTNPLQLIRASRHYEGAGQLLIRKGCMTVSNEIRIYNSSIMPWNTWMVCETSARIDLSGGWSDTPPICYENGGAVVNACIKIDGKRPIGCRIKRINNLCVRFVEIDERGQVVQALSCHHLSDFMDYNQPFSPGALLKACFILSKSVDVESSMTLSDQLKSRFSGGFEIQTWANLPRGSGMGTSSILAGAVLNAIYRATGKLIDCHSLIHSVLLLEQMLTTGGGWQDQVGGLMGGVKICKSNHGLPLQIVSQPIECPNGFLDTFEKHMLLLYTGKTRLARNLLQNVLRNWYACETKVTSNCQELISNAEQCALAFKQGDITAIAECISCYWEQKKVMAPGCEPILCTNIMNTLNPCVMGQTLAGAGGGGFLFAITKQQMVPSDVEILLKDLMNANEISVHQASIDHDGMQTYTVGI